MTAADLTLILIFQVYTFLIWIKNNDLNSEITIPLKRRNTLNKRVFMRS